MSRDKVIVPVAGLGVVMVLSKGWLTALWRKIFAIAHTGQDAFSSSSNPFNPVIVGTGGDLAVSSFPSLANPQYTLGGTIHDNQFTPSDSRIPTFTCGGGGTGACVIPDDIIALLKKLGL